MKISFRVDTKNEKEVAEVASLLHLCKFRKIDLLKMAREIEGKSPPAGYLTFDELARIFRKYIPDYDSL